MSMMTPASGSRTRLRARHGFTIIEVVVVAIILALVGGMLMKMLFKQQQFYNGTTDLMQLRGQLRQAEAVLGSDLRGVSSMGNEITAMSDSSIDFQYTYGSSILCTAPNNNASTFTLPPTARAVGAPLTTWLNRPQAGDIVYMLDDKTPTVLSDDAWIQGVVSTVTATPGLCGAPYTTAADATTNSYSLVLTNGISSSTVRQGAVVRFARPAHYSLYQSSDGQWYLGYCNGACSSSNPINPIAGPFSSYFPANVLGTSGIRLTYYDNAGAQIMGAGASDRASVSRISVVLRGQTRASLSIDGLARGVYTDSMRFDIALRNNR